MLDSLSGLLPIDALATREQAEKLQKLNEQG